MPLSNGKWAYLGAWIDVYSRTIVGWKVADNMKDVLVYEPLLSAIKNRKPPEGLIIHSDRGRQYSSDEFRKIVKRYKLTQSMSRTKNPYDNAFAESLWGRLKNELLENGQFMSLEDARTEVFEYIEMYYNRKRLHSALEYNTPVHFETQYYNNSVN